MITISSSQMEHFRQTMDKRTVQSFVSWLRESHPVAAQSATPAGLEQAATLGLARARGYGFTQEEDLRLFLDLMLSFGSDFDTDPQYLWLRPLLQGIEGVSAPERERLLRWHTSLYFGRTNGTDGRVAALERFGQLDMPALESAGKDPSGLGSRLVAQLHPERLDYMEPEAMEGLLRRAQSDGVAFGAESPAATALFFALMFLFGHGVRTDALYPWIGEAWLQGRDGETEPLLNQAKAFALAMATQMREAKP